jgi:chemotaxis signal transduction protein
MSKYLTFSGGGLKFLLPIDNIVELYDADASAEAVDKVMTGDIGRVYWRGVLSSLLDINAVLSVENSNNNNCFIVCKTSDGSGNYAILKVDAIHELVDMPASSFRVIDIENPALKNIADQVCIMPGYQELFYLMHDIDMMILYLHIHGYQTDDAVANSRSLQDE